MVRSVQIVVLAVIIALSSFCLVQDADADVAEDVSGQFSASYDGNIIYLKGNCVIETDTTIPSGVTVVLCCKETDTGYQNGRNLDGALNGTKSSRAFTTLTIPDGISLEIKGTLLVNSETCQPVWYCNLGITGDYARIVNNGAIKVSSGGVFDNYGIVDGSGQIIADDGSTLRDRYVVDHWRGGSNAQGCYSYKVYPMNEYHMDGISCDVRINSGASYVGTVKLFVNGGFNHAYFPQIDDSNGLIRLSSGSYATIGGGNPKTITIFGGATFSESSLSLQGVTVSTSDFVFPMDGDITMVLDDGEYYVEDGFKMMPGGKLILRDSDVIIGPDGCLAVYDYFIDETSWTSGGPTTEYPQRDPAYIEMDPLSSITVHGNLGGRVFLNDISQVTFATGSSSYCSTREVKDIPTGDGYSTYYKNVSHYTTLVVGSPSTHLAGYWTDPAMSSPWDLNIVRPGMVLYSTGSGRDVCDSMMLSVAENDLLSGEGGSDVPSVPSNSTDRDSLADLISSAVQGDVILLDEDCELDADAVVHEGVTLVLCCKEGDTGYQNGRNHDGSEGDVSSLFMTMTIKEGVTLYVEGTVLVNSVTCYPKWYCNLNFTGGYAKMVVEGEIIVREGGMYDNFGVTSGSGQVIAEKGGVVRDRYVIDHWRGGSTAVSCYQNGVYPMNEYSMKGISCTLLIESGGSLQGAVKLFVNNGYSFAVFPQIDNENGLVRLDDGSVAIKAVSQGRTSVEIIGGATFCSSTLTMGGMSVDTGQFSFPLDGDIDLILRDGSYRVDADFKVMPGATMTLVDSRLDISSGSDLSVYDYFVDETSWKETAEGPTTEYPKRDPAYIFMDGNSSMTVEGSFGGRIFLSDLHQVGFGDGSQTYNVSREVRGEDGVKWISHYTVLIRSGPGVYLSGYWLDAGMGESWDAESIPAGMILYSDVSEVPVCEDWMLSVSEKVLVEVPDLPTKKHYGLYLAASIAVAGIVSMGVMILRRGRS